MWLGDELGLYRSMAGKGPLRREEVAAGAGCNPRLTGEWLDSQAAAGLVEYEIAADTYSLSGEAALILANEDAPTFMARGMNTLMAMFIDGQKIAEAFRGDGGLSWGDHDECLFRGTEWFFRPGYRAYLTSEWIPALDGIEEQLQRGAQVADIGCGHGASAVVIAQAFPNSRVHGYDFHSSSIETAVTRATEAGVGDRAEFAVAGAKEFPGRYSLICFFDCLHAWAIRWVSLDTPESILSRTERCCWSNRWHSMTGPRISLKIRSRPCCTPPLPPSARRILVSRGRTRTGCPSW